MRMFAINFSTRDLDFQGPAFLLFMCLASNFIKNDDDYNSKIFADLLRTSCSATSGLVSCLQSQRCAKTQYNLFINCGGSKAKVKGTTYEADSEEATPSSFFRSDYWAYSSTGYFTDYCSTAFSYVVKNTSTLSMNDAQLYKKARRSAISLTYYGFCLMDGPYNVILHFAEIMFTGDKSYQSLGKRDFNIYIQGKLVWKDFNIEIEAGGVGKEVMRNFTADVTKGTLEIRFYWAGKGSTGIPEDGVYGPLISAISVYSDLKYLALQIGLFTLRQIKAATNNFDPANKIGEGGFGSVYKNYKRNYRHFQNKSNDVPIIVAKIRKLVTRRASLYKNFSPSQINLILGTIWRFPHSIFARS
ncbi:hypothetical protein EUGRSUZ_K01777 [Eucalyptus grandis]|uniref:Uncharacterized protein n=2 Tax=Eucalyptus grandis TaxID=71139 RepID=A0ACC3IUU7_EUCGR|nr:hypothetical protein EUGRSUZ_K01777 [Eucalyptus grandis]